MVFKPEYYQYSSAIDYFGKKRMIEEWLWLNRLRMYAMKSRTSMGIVDNKTGNFRIKDKEGYHLGSDGERVQAPSGMTEGDASNYVKENTHFKNSDG